MIGWPLLGGYRPPDPLLCLRRLPAGNSSANKAIGAANMPSVHSQRPAARRDTSQWPARQARKDWPAADGLLGAVDWPARWLA